MEEHEIKYKDLDFEEKSLYIIVRLLSGFVLFCLGALGVMTIQKAIGG